MSIATIIACNNSKQYYLYGKFKNGASQSNALTGLAEKLRTSGSSITHTYTVWPGFAAILKGDTLDYVRRMPEIESVEQDSILSLLEHEVVAPDSVPPAIAEYHDTLVARGDNSYGQGVTVYGIDTGIYIDHECFGGRASFGADFTGEGENDQNGHGTHTAATAVCNLYGIATGAEVKAVKGQSVASSRSGRVLKQREKFSIQLDPALFLGSSLEWTGHSRISNKATSQPSRLCLLGHTIHYSNKRLSNKRLKKAIEYGLHFTIAAGNDGMDAIMTSPARVKEANTIGAVDSNKGNEQASFSNHGRLIDVWAPGANIKSAWIGSPNAENTISGTSMATPYVAGILALALGEYGQMSPADLTAELKKHATPEVKLLATGTATGSANLLAQKW
ncbi:unnamed protein product [Rhizoctonia solani]|nr:unnamed protein product [Rhizoctonia solani]